MAQDGDIALPEGCLQPGTSDVSTPPSGPCLDGGGEEDDEATQLARAIAMSLAAEGEACRAQEANTKRSSERKGQAAQRVCLLWCLVQPRSCRCGLSHPCLCGGQARFGSLAVVVAAVADVAEIVVVIAYCWRPFSLQLASAAMSGRPATGSSCMRAGPGLPRALWPDTWMSWL